MKRFHVQNAALTNVAHHRNLQEVCATMAQFVFLLRRGTNHHKKEGPPVAIAPRPSLMVWNFMLDMGASTMQMIIVFMAPPIRAESVSA